MQLRPYQQESIDAVHEAWETTPATLIVMPTGTGKTVVFGHMIHNEHRRAMVIAHRKELIYQAQDKIHKITGVQPAIEMADQYSPEGGFHADPECVVSTVQTQVAGMNGDGRMTRFKPGQFGMLVVDEAHHATADTYRKVISHYQSNPNLRVLGCTATPDRADEEALGQVFGSVAYCYEINDAISDGWLVPITQQAIEVDGLDLSSVRTTRGDLNANDLSTIMEYERNLHEIAGPTLELSDGRRTLVFCASVAHAERLADIFNRHEPDIARCTHAKTPQSDRAQTVRDFSDGRCRILCNVGIYTEGFDEPGIEVISVARPTKSRSLYAQMVGRGTRPLPGVVDVADGDLFETRGLPDPAYRRGAIGNSDKPSLIVLDFVGNSGRHKLINCNDILGGNYSDEVVDRAERNARNTGAPQDVMESLEQAASELDAEEKAKKLQQQRARIAKVNYRTVEVNPFDVLDLRPKRERGWDVGRLPSDKQLAMLRKAGIDKDDMTFTEAGQLCGAVIARWKGNLCTFKQAKILSTRGYDTDVTAKEASAIIDQIAKTEGWRKRA